VRPPGAGGACVRFSGETDADSILDREIAGIEGDRRSRIT
jgi:hypothetical protein